MPHLVLTGAWERATETMAALVRAGYSLTLVREPYPAFPRWCGAQSSELVVAALTSGDSIREAANASHSGLHWLALDLTADPSVIGAAYESGALAVVAVDAAPAVLPRAIQTALAVLMAGPSDAASPGRRVYRQGTPIAVAENELLEVESGVVALGVIHDDGAEGLLGLFGPGQILVGHSIDGCHARAVAHTDTTVAITRWEDAFEDPGLSGRLRGRLREMEAWAAMQARPHLDERILGTLALLAAQFGRSGGESLVVDVRVTHAQLAAAVGATRATVTRTIGGLRRRGTLASTGSGTDARYCLRERDRNGHVSM